MPTRVGEYDRNAIVHKCIERPHLPCIACMNEQYIADTEQRSEPKDEYIRRRRSL